MDTIKTAASAAVFVFIYRYQRPDRLIPVSSHFFPRKPLPYGIIKITKAVWLLFFSKNK